jgi:hypothetical protein
MKTEVLVAIGVLIASFAAGFFVARSGQGKPAAVVATTSPTPTDELAENIELLQCREELAKAMQPAVDVSIDAPAPSPEEEKITQLEEEFRQCRKRDSLDKAELCVTVDRYYYLYLASLHADGLCEDRPRLGDLILQHSEQCANFEDQTPPLEMDLGNLSENEDNTLYRAKHFGRPKLDPRIGDQKTNLNRSFKRTLRECHEKFGLSDE